MKVLEFIKKNKNWEELLAQAPYFVKTVRDGEYFLLKYNQLSSDFSNEIVRECRGCIFFEPEMRPVCVPFYKFGNYGESYVPELNWDQITVKEKIDGSLMKVWYHRGWHVSTNNTINAYKASTSIDDLTFGRLFWSILEQHDDPAKFFASLNFAYTYMFEMVAPETRVTIEYPDRAIYFLGARRNDTMRETFFPDYVDTATFDRYVKYPKRYALNTLDDCIQYASTLDQNHEGFVACDNNFNRVKIKTEAYLAVFHMRNNNVITTRRVIEMMRANILDDFCAYAPDLKYVVDETLMGYNNYVEALNKAAMKYLPADNIAALAQQIRDLPSHISGYLFALARGKVSDAFEWINIMPQSTLVDVVKMYKSGC